MLSLLTRYSTALNLSILVVVIMIAAFVFGQSADSFFYLEDYIFLEEARRARIADIFQWFDPNRTGFLGFYRPFSREMFFWVGNQISGLEPWGYHLLQIGVHVGSTMLVYHLLNHIIGNRFSSLLGAVFYGANTVHFESLYWMSGFQELSVTFFVLAAFYLYVSQASRSTTLRRRVFWSWICAVLYLLGLFSKETAVVLPAVVMAYELMRYPSSRKQVLLLRTTVSLVPLFAIGIGYAWLRGPALWRLASDPNSGHAVDISGLSSIAGKLLWGMQWSLDLYLQPLVLAKAFMFPRLHLGGLRNALLMVAVLLAVGVAYSFSRELGKQDQSSYRTGASPIFLGILWFLLFFLPAGFISAFARYYFVSALVGVSMIIGLVWVYVEMKLATFPKQVVYGLFGLIVIVTIFSGKLQVQDLSRTAWPAMQTRIAKATITRLQEYDSQVGHNSTIYLLGFPQRIWYKDSAEAAFRVFYNDSIREVAIDRAITSHENGRFVQSPTSNHSTVSAIVIRYENGFVQ